MLSQQAEEALATIKEQRATLAADSGAAPDPVAMRQNAAEAPPAPADTTVIEVDADGVPAEWVLAPGADPDARLLYFHGGGYVTGSAAMRRQLCAHLSRVTGCALLNTEYRLAPEHPYPAAVDDGIAALRWMRANGPHGPGDASGTFVAGDSAGGGLTLATLMRARDEGEAACDGAVGLSAWTDMTLSGSSFASRLDHDPMIDRARIEPYVQYYLGDTDPEDVLASPVFGDFAGLPPLLMQVGDYEVLLDDSVRVVDRARAAGVDATLKAYPEMWHVFQSNVGMPEAQQAIEQIGAFVRQRITATV